MFVLSDASMIQQSSLVCNSMIAADPCIIYIELPLPFAGRIYTLICILYIIFVKLKPLAGPGGLVHYYIADIILFYKKTTN